MRTMMRAALVILGLGLGSQAMAAYAWKTNLPIEGIIPHPSGVLLMLTASDPNCGVSGNQFNAVINANGQTADGVKMILSVALVALTTGRTVDVVVDTSIAGCPVQQIRINP